MDTRARFQRRMELITLISTDLLATQLQLPQTAIRSMQRPERLTLPKTGGQILAGQKPNDIGNGAGTVTSLPALTLTLTPGANPIAVGTTTPLTASFLKDTAGTTQTLANLVTLIGLPVSFGATTNTVTGADTTIQNTAMAAGTYNGIVKVHNDSVHATVDGASAILLETVLARSA